MSDKEKEIRFEQALKRLEALVRDMDSEEISLEDSLKKYEEGVGLYRLCRDQIGRFEKKVEILKKDLEGNLETEPFQPEEEG